MAPSPTLSDAALPAFLEAYPFEVVVLDWVQVKALAAARDLSSRGASPKVGGGGKHESAELLAQALTPVWCNDAWRRTLAFSRPPGVALDVANAALDEQLPAGDVSELVRALLEGFSDMSVEQALDSLSKSIYLASCGVTLVASFVEPTAIVLTGTGPLRGGGAASPSGTASGSVTKAWPPLGARLARPAFTRVASSSGGTPDTGVPSAAGGGTEVTEATETTGTTESSGKTAMGQVQALRRSNTERPRKEQSQRNVGFFGLEDEDDPSLPQPTSQNHLARRDHLPPSLSAVQFPTSSQLHPFASMDPFLRWLAFTSGTTMGKLIANFDWSTTALGPLSRWRPELKSMVTRILTSPFREALFVGRNAVCIYNDVYIEVAGPKHNVDPEAGLLGKDGPSGWSELWEELGPLLTNVFDTGITESRFDHYLSIESRFKPGRTEETYHLWSYNVFTSDSGEVLGVSNLSFETTSSVLTDRRLATLRDASTAIARSRTSEEFCTKLFDSLESNPFDLPFVMLYEVQQRPQNLAKKSQKARESQETITPVTLVCRGGIGVPDGHPLAPGQVDLVLHHLDSGPISSADSSSAGGESRSTTSFLQSAPFPFEEACVQHSAVYLRELDESSEAFDARAWGMSACEAVVVPCSIDQEQRVPNAVLVIGLNPQGVWDDSYSTFVSLLARQVATGLVAVSNAEHDARVTEELLAIDKAKTIFFSTVSHELRLPLTLILGPLQDLLALNDLDKSVIKQLKLMQRNGTRLLYHVNSLLDFSSLETRRMNMTFRATRISAVVADLASLFRSAIERWGVAFSVACAPDPKKGEPVYISIDFFEKAILNLLGNATKFTVKGKVGVKVSFTALEAIIDITDTGCGIEKAELDRIFERFHRSEATSRAHEGTGIGLALTMEVVKAHSGTIEVESEVGVGSTFTVRLPRGSQHLHPSQIDPGEEPVDVALPRRDLTVVQVAESWRMSKVAPLTSTSDSSTDVDPKESSDGGRLFEGGLASLRSSLVLIADDNSDLREYLSDMLRPHVRVASVSDGQAAYEFCLETPPDLVLSDVMMPRKDGLELLAALRANPRTCLIPIVLLSARAGLEARSQALESGCDDYLEKPFERRELLARVRVHLQIGKMRLGLERQVEERTAAVIESERLRANLLEEKAREAVDSRRSLERFVDFMSHELRNPMNGIWQNTEAIAEGIAYLVKGNEDWEIGTSPSASDLKSWRDEIQRIEDAVESVLLCAAHQQRIADDILSVSKIQLSLVSVQPRPFNLPKKIKEALRMYELECRRQDTELTLEVGESCRKLDVEWLVGDANRIIQVTLNFISNAVKVVVQQAENRKVAVRLEAYAALPPERPSGMRIGTPGELVNKHKPWIRVSVTDSGHGMSSAEMSLLFSRFSQLHPMTDQATGSGLGLYICRKLIELQDGCIEVESTEGKGSEFSFLIPLLRTTPGTEPGTEPGTPIGPNRSPSPGLSSLAKAATPGQDKRAAGQGGGRARRVLVVEDNAINQKVLRRQLETNGFKVSTADHGREALDRLLLDSQVEPQERICIVLMDLEMPVMGGMEAVKLLRQYEADGKVQAGIPVVAITGNARVEQIDMSLAAGFNSAILKPYKLKDVLAAIDQLALGPAAGRLEVPGTAS